MCLSGGLQFVEFTLNSEDSLCCIEYASKKSHEDLCVGGETLEAAAMFDKSVSLLLKQADDANDYLRKMV